MKNGHIEHMPLTCPKCQGSRAATPADLHICPDCGGGLSTSSLPVLGSAELRALSHHQSQPDEMNILSTMSTMEVNSKPERVDTPISIIHPRLPTLAALLSFLLVGMGQIYLGQVEKGLCLLATILLLIVGGVPTPIAIAMFLLNVLDAFLLAQ